MKSILIIQPWISYRGAESVSLEEAWGLRELGHKVSILCLYLDKNRLRKKDLKLNFILPPESISRFCQRSNVFFFVFGFFILLFLMLRNGKKFNVYNPHNFPSVWVAVITSLFYKKKVFWTVHNFPQHGFTNPLTSKYWERATYKIDQFLVSKVSGIICVSEKVQTQVDHFYGLKSTVIYPAVDIEFYSKGKLISHAPFVLVPSKLHELKNPFFVLKVIKRFKEFGGEATFVFAGEGGLLENLRRYVKKYGLSKNIEFLEFVPKERLVDYYKTASLIFLPGDYYEGFNVVVLEALASKTPSLVLTGCGIDTWVRTCNVGFVVDKSVDIVAKRIKTILINKNILKNVGERGYKLVSLQNNPKKYAQEVIEEMNR